jgi:hypothetical protein
MNRSNLLLRHQRRRSGYIAEMIVSDLLEDARKAGDVTGGFRVLLATRTVDGVEMDAGRVQLSDAGQIQIDPSSGEVDVLPTACMDDPGPCLCIADFRRLVSEAPEAADFTLSGVTRCKQLADGGRVSLTEQALGTHALAEQGEIWLLLYPEEQWPRHWFEG